MRQKGEPTSLADKLSVALA